MNKTQKIAMELALKERQIAASMELLDEISKKSEWVDPDMVIICGEKVLKLCNEMEELLDKIS